MARDYDKCTVVELRDMLWERGLLPKRWMLNYVRKAEAIYLLTNITGIDSLPPNYIKTIKERCSQHRKKVYRSKKNRQQGFGTPLTREERLRLVMNTAESLTYVEVKEFDDGFTSYLGSKRGKVAFIFKDAASSEYQFTRSEVEKLSSMGLYIPRGVLSHSRNRVQRPAKTSRTLKDIFDS